jgi:hypothetical protein
MTGLAEAVRKRIAAGMEGWPGIFQEVYEKKLFSRNAYNVMSFCQDMMLRGMTYARIEGDFKKARTDFLTAVEKTLEFEKILDLIAKNSPPERERLHIYSLEVPIYACLLGGAWDRANKLAKMTFNPAVVDLEDPLNALTIRMLAALLLDDGVEFSRLQAKYQAAKPKPWHKIKTPYLELYDSVMNRDQGLYAKRAHTALELFGQRGTKKKLQQLIPISGGGEYNSIVLDYMSCGIAVVAKKREMTAFTSDPFVPPEIIEGI